MRFMWAGKAVLIAASIVAFSACHGSYASQMLPANSTAHDSNGEAAVSGWQFRPIGPTHMLEDYPMNTSGKLNAFAQDPRDPKVVYTAGGRGTGSEVYSSAGIYKTTNGGMSWQPIDTGLTDLSGGIFVGGQRAVARPGASRRAARRHGVRRDLPLQQWRFFVAECFSNDAGD